MLAIFAAVALAHFLALLSPGPDFVMIVKSAVRHSARVAIGVAAGIAAANAVYIGLCLAGVATLLSQSAGLLMLVRIAGGLFLIWLGLCALRARKSDYAALLARAGEGALDAADPADCRRAFWHEFAAGFASGILNPKNLLFYLSLFSLVLTADVGLAFKMLLVIWMTAVVFLWEAAIVLLLTRGAVRAWFDRSIYYLDKATGMLLGTIGIKVVHGAASQT
ncbi:LysE family transporter [Lampropedia cohaerens]|nr:LysE family transporter [Lampropedia cohaerens]